jgi:SNF2 family DNA or RNA helicase
MKAAELNLPTKTEIIVDVELTAVQMKYYREMYERNIDTLADVEHERASEKGGAPAVSNLMMELRKVPVCVCMCVRAHVMRGCESAAKVISTAA